MENTQKSNRITGHDEFHQYGNDIRQGDVGYVTFIAHAYNNDNAKLITDKLNELLQENKGLKKELKDEKLKSWRIINHLKTIGWNEEYILGIMDNNYGDLLE